MATGMAVCGFGGGAILIAQLKKRLLEYNFEAPTYVGAIGDVITKRSEETGKLMAKIGEIGAVNEWQEVLSVTKHDILNMGVNIEEGIYLVGTGNTGVAATMATLGTAYLGVIVTSSLLTRVPRQGFKPPSMIEAERKALEAQNKTVSKKEDEKVINYVDIDDLMKTPQFWLLWTSFLTTCSAGVFVCSIDLLVCLLCFFFCGIYCFFSFFE